MKRYLYLMLLTFSGASKADSDLNNVFHCEYKKQSVDFYLNKEKALYIHKKEGVIDFIYPSEHGGKLELFNFETRPTIGGAETEMSFRNGNYKYVIYDVSRNNIGDYEYDSGFYVVSKGNRVNKKSCENEGATIKKLAYDVFQK